MQKPILIEVQCEILHNKRCFAAATDEADNFRSVCDEGLTDDYLINDDNIEVGFVCVEEPVKIVCGGLMEPVCVGVCLPCCTNKAAS